MKQLLTLLVVGLFGLPVCVLAQSGVTWEDLLVLPSQSEVRLVVRGGVPVAGRILSVTADAIELRSREALQLRVPESVYSDPDHRVWRFPRDLVMEPTILKVAPYTARADATPSEIGRVVRAIGTGRRVEVRSRADESCRGRIQHIDDNNFRVDCDNRALRQIAFGPPVPIIRETTFPWRLL
jgi:hypothetical protein